MIYYVTQCHLHKHTKNVFPTTSSNTSHDITYCEIDKIKSLNKTLASIEQRKNYIRSLTYISIHFPCV